MDLNRNISFTSRIVAPGSNGGVRPPTGFVFLTDSDGAYLTGSDGAYLVEAA